MYNSRADISILLRNVYRDYKNLYDFYCLLLKSLFSILYTYIMSNSMVIYLSNMYYVLFCFINVLSSDRKTKAHYANLQHTLTVFVPQNKCLDSRKF